MKYILIVFCFLLLVSCSSNNFIEQNNWVAQENTLTWKIDIIEVSEVPVDEFIKVDSQTQDIQDQKTIIDNNCFVFDDFTQSIEYRWGIVNDGVMGGKSKWIGQIENNSLVFSWTIITRWGWFSSLRWNLDVKILSEYNSVKLKAKSDGRKYQITFRDSWWRNISHQAIILFQTSEEFEEITIPFSDLQPAYFGRIVNSDPFDKESAREIGIILSDWVDGEFRFEIDEISFCK